MYYARWQGGEVDIVRLGDEQKPAWAVEVKWSDRYCKRPGELKSLISFCNANGLKDVVVTSKTQTVTCKVEGIPIRFIPASVYCYSVGYNIIHGRINLSLREQLEFEESHSPAETEEAQLALSE